MDIIRNFIERYRSNRRILLFIVCVALFLDNMLLTTVVPIIPEYFIRLSHPNETNELLHSEIDIRPVGRAKRAVEWSDLGDEWDDDLSDAQGDETRYNYDDEDRPKTTVKYRSRKKPKQRASTTNRDRLAVTTALSVDAEEYIEKVRQHRHEALAEENVHVGLMFGSKALVQLIANPLVGPWTNKIGYTIPMFSGFVIMFLSTVMFAFGSSYGTLWLARALQGVGSACTSTSGMGMLAQAYPDDAERGSVMGIALGGLALGLLVGPPYGGLLYQWAGKELPFIILALMALLDGVLQFMVLQPKVDRGEPEGAGFKELLKDPYIIVTAGSITIGNLGMAMIEPSLPLWMMESWGASSIQRGAVFLPASISYMIGTNIFGPLAHRIGRWLSCFIGLVVIGFCLLAIPSATSISGLIIPNFCLGFSIGMIDASMFPMMGFIADLRHVGVYGSVYAIADAAFCFAFALGPFFSGPLVRSVGFPAMMHLMAVVNLAYAPMMFFLRKLPTELPERLAKEEAQTGEATVSDKRLTVENGHQNSKNNNPFNHEAIPGINDPALQRLATGNGYQYETWND